MNKLQSYSKTNQLSAKKVIICIAILPILAPVIYTLLDEGLCKINNLRKKQRK